MRIMMASIWLLGPGQAMAEEEAEEPATLEELQIAIADLMAFDVIGLITWA